MNIMLQKQEGLKVDYSKIVIYKKDCCGISYTVNQRYVEIHILY